MQIHDFTPLPALAGGILIGLAAALLALFTGRIAGISGIAARLLSGDGEDRAWRLAFIAGLALAPWAWRLVAAGPASAAPASPPLLLLGAGLLVGIGTRLAGGCTSGHGVCGLARRSPRSLLAVASFMTAGFATVWMLRQSGVLA